MKKAKIFLGLAVVLITVLFAVIACKDEDSEEAKKTEEQSGPTYVANVLPAPAKKITVDYLDEFEGQYVTIIGSIDGGMLYTFKAVDSNGVVTFGKITNGTVELPVYKLDAGNSSFSSSTAYNGTGSVTAMIRVMGNLEKVAFSQITTYYPTDNDKKRDRTSSFTSENTLALSWLDPGEPFTSIAQFKSWYDKQLATGANGTPYNVKINISDLGGVNPSAKDYYARQNSNLNYWVINENYFSYGKGGLGEILYNNSQLSQTNWKLVNLDLSGSTFTIMKIFTFAECSNIKSITLPTTVQEIGNGVFRECSNITTIIIPANVTYLSYIFNGNTGITSVTISNGTITNENFNASGGGLDAGLKTAYFNQPAESRAGTYTRPNTSATWTKTN